MWQAFINVIFTVLNWIASIFLAPIFLVLSLIAPSYTDYITYFNQYLGWGLNKVNFFIELFMIPRGPLIAVVSLGIGILTFNVTLRVVGLAIALWKWFKP